MGVTETIDRDHVKSAEVQALEKVMDQRACSHCAHVKVCCWLKAVTQLFSVPPPKLIPFDVVTLARICNEFTASYTMMERDPDLE